MTRDPNYERTAEQPCITARQALYLQCLQKPSLDYLGEAIYRENRNDLASVEDGKYHKGQILKNGTKAMYQALAEDEDGPRHLIKLLHIMNKRAIESIILNRVGYDMEDPDFKDCFYEIDNMSGIYLLTFGRRSGRDKGKGLTILEWEAVCIEMRKYHEFTNPEEAALIDRIFWRKKKTMEEVLELTEIEDNAMWFGGWEIFCEAIDRLRMPRDLDPRGRIRQIQAPTKVGCSKNIQKRLQDHDPWVGLNNSSKSWALLLSILKKLNIDVDVVQVCVLKIWEEKQLKIGEILISNLAGSSVYEAGVDERAPGTTKVVADKEKFQEALRQIFVARNWASENIRESNEELKRKEELLDVHIDLLDGTIDLNNDDNARNADVQRLEESMNNISKAIDMELETENDFSSRIKGTFRMLRASNTEMEGWLDLHGKLRAWVDDGLKTIEDAEKNGLLWEIDLGARGREDETELDPGEDDTDSSDTEAFGNSSEELSFESDTSSIQISQTDSIK